MLLCLCVCTSLREWPAQAAFTTATLGGPKANRRRVRAGLIPPVPVQPQACGRRTGAPRSGSTTSRAGADACQEKLSSVSQSTVNLVKNIVGGGMLSMPAGVAAFSGDPKALVPAITLTLIFGLMSAYAFVLIADACSSTGESSFQGAWSRTLSPQTSWLPSLACVANAGIGCICYSMILGDCLSLILAPLGLHPVLASRNSLLLAVSALVLFPLCSMRSLAPLAKFSVLGVLSNVFISFFVSLRCLDGSYRAGGAFLAAAPVAPSFTASSSGAWQTVLRPSSTVLLSILGTAFLAHYNAPLFYQQLAPDSTGNRKDRFLTTSVLGFAIAGVIFSVVMAGGFLTFGSNSSGLILNNYAATDPLAMGARVAIALSLITAYPIVFFSVREQCLGFLGKRGSDLAAKRPLVVTLGLLGGITAIALRLRDLSRVAAFAGAVFGIFLIYIAPPLMVMAASWRGLKPRPKPLRRSVELTVQLLLVPLGAVLGVIGAVESLK